eukprot:m.195516 g.195516  ORF g.195516 m.195516 type:complete len:251 (-) comp16804_c0_seq2:1954-2706(-)
MAAQRARLARELVLLQKSPPPGITCWTKSETEMHLLLADVAGPPDTPYQEGVFRVELDCSGRYPFEPPKARFITPIYHPNIDTAGRICLDLLKMPPKGSWKPSINIATLLTSLQVLMSEPNPDDGLLPDVSSEYKYRRSQFLERAKEHTRQHAVKRVTSPPEATATATTTMDAPGTEASMPLSTASRDASTPSSSRNPSALQNVDPNVHSIPGSTTPKRQVKRTLATARSGTSGEEQDDTHPRKLSLRQP